MPSDPPRPSSDASRPPLKIVFIGTPVLAAHILENLIGAAGLDFNLAGVVTRPDQPRKRGLKLEPSEVGALAERHRIRTLKPAKIRTPEFLAELKAFDPDLLVIAAYGRILPAAVLELPHIMPINVHASLLPRHRGAAPIEGALLAGDSESGVTIMRVTERMDAGPILLQRRIALSSDETQGSLKEKIAAAGSIALLEAIAALRKGEIVETPQDDNLATYTSPIAKEHAVIDWQSAAVQIERMVRAYDPWPVARTTLFGDDLLVWRSSVCADDDSDPAIGEAPPGTIIRLRREPVVKCGSGMLTLVEVQAAGRRRMAAADFMRGRRVEAGTLLGA